MAGELGKVVVIVGGDASALEKAIAEIKKAMGEGEKSAQKLGDKLKKTGEQLQQVGRPMMAFGAAITGGLGLAVKAFGDFDAAMNESLAIMGDVTDTQRGDMVRAAEDVARTTTFSAKEAAAAYYYLASAGLDAEQSIAALPAVAQFAQAGMMDLETATSYLMDSQSALGLKVDDAAQNMENMVRVSDVLVEAANASNGSIEQFSSALANSAPMMRQLNMDVEEGVAVLAVYADQGIKSEEAGTRFSIVLRDLQTRAIKNKDAFEKYNVAVYDSNGMMRNMSDIIGDLERALAGKTDEQKKAILAEMEFQDRSVSSMLSLVGMSKEIANYESKLRSAGGTTKEVSEKQLETLNNQIKIAKNNIEIAAKTIGGQLAPVVTRIAKGIAEAAQSYEKWSAAHPGLSKAITGVATVLGSGALVGGTLLFALGSVAKSIGAIINLFPGLKAGMIGAAGAVTTLAAEMAIWLTTLVKIKAALDYESDANDRLSQQNIKLENNLYKLVAAGKMTVDQFYALKDQFYQGGKGADDYALKMRDWIKSGKAGKEAAEGLAEQTAESAKQFKAAGAGAKGAAGAVDDLGDSMGDAAGDAKSLKEELGLIFVSDLKKRIGDIEKALKLYKGQLAPDQEKALREDLINLNIAAGQFTIGLTKLSVGFRSSYENYQNLVAALEWSGGTWEQLIAKTGLTRVQFVDLANQFVILGNAAVHNVGKVTVKAKEMGVAWQEVLLQLAKDIATAFSGILSGTATFGQGMRTIFSALGTNLGQALGTNITESLSSSLGKMAGPVGALFGGVVGGILNEAAKAIFGVSAAEQEAADDAKEWAENVAELGVAAAETAAKFDELYETVGAVSANALILADQFEDRFAETAPTIDLINLSISELTGQLLMFQSGELDAATATKALDEAFSVLLEQAQTLGFEGTVALGQFIQQAREMGLEIPSVIAYVNEQLGVIPATAMNAAEGLAAMATGAAPGFAALQARATELTQQLSNMDPGDEAFAGLQAELAAVQAQIGTLAISSEDDLKRVENSALAVFNAMIANGASYTEALNSIGPALDILAAEYAGLGLEAGPAIEQLLKIRDVQVANEDLFAAIDGNRAVFEALANTGFMTSEALADTAAQAADYYQQLQAAGMTSQEALATMAPTLQSLQDYANKYGITLDDNTLALIEQADALNLIADTPVDPGTAMAEGFKAVTGALNNVVSLLSNAFPQAAAAAGTAISSKIGTAVTGVNTALGAVNATIKTTIPTAAGTAGTAITSKLGAAVTGVGTGLAAVNTAIATTIPASATSAGTAVTSKLGGAASTVNTAFATASNALYNNFNSAIGNVQGGAAQRLADFSLNVKNAWSVSAWDTYGTWNDSLGRISSVAAAVEDTGRRVGDAWKRAAWDAQQAWGDIGVDAGTVPAFAEGGIAWEPTLATVAEHEPEVIIPMSDYVSGTGLAANAGSGAAPGSGSGMGAGASAGVTINYAPVIQAMDSQDVYRFMAGAGKDALIDIVRSNTGGLTRVIAQETDKY